MPPDNVMILLFLLPQSEREIKIFSIPRCSARTKTQRIDVQAICREDEKACAHLVGNTDRVADNRVDRHWLDACAFLCLRFAICELVKWRAT